MSPPRQAAGASAVVVAPTGYLSLLRTDGVAPMLVAALVARMPVGMSSLSILLLTRQATGSFGVSGAAVGALAAGLACTTPFQGRAADRVGPRPVVITMAMTQSVFTTLLLIAANTHASGVLLVLLAAPVGACTPPIAASARALWPRLVADAPRLERIYALEAIAQELMWTTGPLAVAVAVAVGSPSLALATCAVVSILGTLWFASLPAAREPPNRSADAGQRSPLAIVGLRRVLASVLLGGFAFGTVEVALPAVAHDLGAPAATGGVLLALMSIGSMVGGLIYGAVRWTVPLQLRYAAMMLLFGLAALPLTLAGSILEALPLSALVGLAMAPMLSCVYALVARLTTSDVRTEAFTWTTSATFGGLAAGSALAGVAIDRGGPHAALALTALAGAVGSALVLVSRRQLESSPSTER